MVPRVPLNYFVSLLNEKKKIIIRDPTYSKRMFRPQKKIYIDRKYFRIVNINVFFFLPETSGGI